MVIFSKLYQFLNFFNNFSSFFNFNSTIITDPLIINNVLIKCFYLSKISYLPYDNLIYNNIDEFKNNLINYYDAIKISNQYTYAYMWYVNNIIYISFRGTNNVGDIIADSKIIFKHFNDIYKTKVESEISKSDACKVETEATSKVHTGFLEQFIAVEKLISNDIDKILKLNNNNIDTIIFTGHSLGGAVSTIASLFYNIKYENKIKIKNITFGSPKVGNEIFTNLYNSSNIIES